MTKERTKQLFAVTKLLVDYYQQNTDLLPDPKIVAESWIRSKEILDAITDAFQNKNVSRTYSELDLMLGLVRMMILSNESILNEDLTRVAL